MSDASGRSPDDTVGLDEDRTDLRGQMARALAQGGFSGVHVLSIDSAEKVLTGPRMGLIDYLRTHEVESIRELAREMDRDKGNVSRDLKLLAKYGIIDFDTSGRGKRPFLKVDHLVVEPIF